MTSSKNPRKKYTITKILPIIITIALVTYSVITTNKNDSENLDSVNYHEDFSEVELKKMEEESKATKEDLIAQYFNNPDKNWTQDQVFPLVLNYLIREKIEDIKNLKILFEKDSSKLSDNELGIQASAYVVNHYLEKSYNGKQIIITYY